MECQSRETQEGGSLNIAIKRFNYTHEKEVFMECQS